MAGSKYLTLLDIENAYCNIPRDKYETRYREVDTGYRRRSLSLFPNTDFQL
jgi:hypothetical protein